MSNIFAKLTTEGIDKPEDFVGGSKTLPSNIYEAIIKTAYAEPSAGGALGVHLNFTIEGKDYFETQYVTNRKGDNFYLSKKNQKKVFLPGYVTVDDLCIIAAGKSLQDVSIEKKIIKAFDRETRDNINKEVDMIMDLIGQKVALAIQEVKDFRSVKQGDIYVPTEETKLENAISKVLHPTEKLTVSEAKQGNKSVFWDTWLKNNEGQIYDKTKGKTPITKASKGNTPSPAVKSLFED